MYLWPTFSFTWLWIFTWSWYQVWKGDWVEGTVISMNGNLSNSINSGLKFLPWSSTFTNGAISFLLCPKSISLSWNNALLQTWKILQLSITGMFHFDASNWIQVEPLCLIDLSKKMLWSLLNSFFSKVVQFFVMSYPLLPCQHSSLGKWQQQLHGTSQSLLFCVHGT